MTEHPVTPETHVDKADAWDAIAEKNDEIERLRAEAIRLRSYNEGLAKIAAQQDEQIERLRAALTRIRDRADKAPSVEAEEALNEIGHVADEALEQGAPNGS